MNRKIFSRINSNIPLEYMIILGYLRCNYKYYTHTHTRLELGLEYENTSRLKICI